MTEVRCDLCRRIAALGHQRGEAVPESVRRRPRNTCSSGSRLEHATAVVVGVDCGVPISVGKTGSVSAAKAGLGAAAHEPMHGLRATAGSPARPRASWISGSQARDGLRRPGRGRPTASREPRRCEVPSRRGRRQDRAWSRGISASSERVSSAVSLRRRRTRWSPTTTRTPAAGLLRMIPSSYAVASIARTGAR